MPTEVVLPRLGLTQEEGTVVRWIKPEGSTVKKGEPLFEVMTDKATVEVEAPASGVLLRILVAEGGTVPVATPIALIGEAGEALPVIPPPGPVPAAASSAATSGGAPRAETGAPTPAPPREAAAGGAAPTGGPSGGQTKTPPRAPAPVIPDIAPAPMVGPAPVIPDVASAPIVAPAPAMPDLAPAPPIEPVTPAEAEAPRGVEVAAPAPSPVATRMRAIIAARMME